MDERPFNKGSFGKIERIIYSKDKTMKKLAEVKTQDKNSETKLMSEMDPLEVCVVCDHSMGSYNGTLVMRTASLDNFEVINLSNLGADICWEDPNSNLRVSAYDGDKIVLILKSLSV